jgi:thiamine pyrophosphate-dependent acetolactate synthase large subunit-like protein
MPSSTTTLSGSASATNPLWSGNGIRQSGEQRIIGSFNNGAVGTALGRANGIQALDRSRQVIALCGEGGFSMLMCEFDDWLQKRQGVFRPSSGGEKLRKVYRGP